MASFSSSLLYYFNTLVGTQGFAGFIANSLSACGWVQSADTGQTSVANMTNTSASYFQVWTMGDSLQSVTPVYLLLSYSFINPNVSFSVAVASATNGAGGLINPSPTQNLIPSQGPNATYPCYASGASDRFSCWMYAGSAYPALFTIERAQSATGGSTRSFVTLATWNQGSILYRQSTLFPSGAQNTETTPLVLHTTNPSGILAGRRTIISPGPVYPIVGANPMVSLVCFKNADIGTQGAAVPVSMYGNTYNYLPIGSYNNGFGPQTLISNTQLGLLYS